MVDNLQPTSASAWKGKVQHEGADVELPSGNVARVRRLSPQAFLSGGMIPDPLTGIIRKAINTKQGMKPEMTQEIIEDPKMIESAMEMFDRVLAYAVIMPDVTMPPPCTECGEYFNVDQRHTDVKHEGYHKYTEGKRDPESLYADEVDMTDKIFIFNWSMGGTSDLKSFREELRTGMGDLPDSEDVPVSPE